MVGGHWSKQLTDAIEKHISPEDFPGIKVGGCFLRHL
jgi:hypothetical protein